MSNNVKKSPLRTGGLILVGVGLLLLGVVTGILLLTPLDNENSQVTGDGYRNSNSLVVPVEVNFKAPDLNLQDLEGSAVSIDDFPGKVILVNNWATWCPPCREEMPALESFYQAHHDDGFTLIAIDAGDLQADVVDFAHRYNLSFPVWLDASNQALQAFKNYGLPNSYVIDKDGVVRLAWTGPISEQMLEKYVTPLLEE